MSRSVLVVNCGSSSIKYQLIDAESETALAKGLVERIGSDDALLSHTGPGGTVRSEQPLADHDAGLRAVLAAFDEAGPNLAEAGLAAVGHRVVHGGDRFADPAVVDDSVLAAIRDLVPLAPLHNPANLEGIEVAMRVFPDVAQVAVFDTAFHQTLPRHAYTYAIDRDVAAELGIRRYGFHGTSHSYVSRTAARLLGKEPSELNMVVLHLGNGASASAVQHGRCIDTSMGLTPLEGLVMGTRSGDIDPAVIFHLRRVGEMTVEQIDTLLNKQSGLLGLCGANDLREVWAMADAGDDDARNALDTYAYRIRKYIGAYALALGALDAVVFTAGVGENDVRMRAKVLEGLERLNIVLDPDRNADPKGLGPVVSTPESNVSVLVVPTNEELEIAQESLRVLAATPSPRS